MDAEDQVEDLALVADMTNGFFDLNVRMNGLRRNEEAKNAGRVAVH